MNAKDTFRVLKQFPVDESILIVGNHGIGKSQVVKQVADSEGIPCIDFRLSQNDVGDLKGMPFHVGGRTVFAPPEFMPLTEEDAKQLKELLNLTDDISMGRYGDKGILFLDEINRASREVQQAAFELVLDRRMNLRALPKGWRVVAAVNGEDDIYTVNSLDPAFLSRFFVINFEPTDQEWFKWAHKEGVHPAIIDFLQRHPDLLDPTPEILSDAAAEGIKKVHDRRAWHKFSNTLNKMFEDHEKGELKHEPLSKDPESLNYLTLVAQGYVGVLAGNRFRGFIETDYQSLDANTILNKYDKDVEKRIKSIAKKGRIVEIGNYNESIIDHIKHNVKDKLNKTQKENLTKYINLLPKETVADLWQRMDQELKDIASDWYQSNDKNSKIILAALINPEAVKKAEDSKED